MKTTIKLQKKLRYIGRSISLQSAHNQKFWTINFPWISQFFQETIAESEYRRAMTFKKQNRNDEALSLLTELLDAKVIYEVFMSRKRVIQHRDVFGASHAHNFECAKQFFLFQVTKENKKKTLFSVKCSCYKNIGFIYKERGESQEALEYLTKVRVTEIAVSLFRFFFYSRFSFVSSPLIGSGVGWFGRSHNENTRWIGVDHG